jgi:hypothetical protein
MNRQRVYRGPRIAVSAFFGLLCVMLVALWVRSYSRADVTSYANSNPNPNRTETFLISEYGAVVFEHFPYGGPVRKGWHFDSFSVSGPPIDFPPMFAGFGYDSGRHRTIVLVPHWFFVLLFVILAAVPWILRKPRFSIRFSIRTLLVVTTLVALLLGLIVAVSG